MTDHGHSLSVNYLELGTYYHLTLQRESQQNWIVLDANNHTVYLRTPDRAFCIRFMRAFAEKHPGTVIDEASIELERERGARRAVKRTRPVLAPVIPIRKETR